MSVAYLGTALIGCEVTDKIPRTRMVRGCGHDVHESWKFCAQCSKPRIVEQRIHLEDTEAFKALESTGMAMAYSTDRERIFAGVAVECWSDNRAKRKDLDFVNVRVAVRAVLEPLGLWNESFGLWCVMFCSN